MPACGRAKDLPCTPALLVCVAASHSCFRRGFSAQFRPAGAIFVSLGTGNPPAAKPEKKAGITEAQKLPAFSQVLFVRARACSRDPVSIGISSHLCLCLVDRFETPALWRAAG